MDHQSFTEVHVFVALLLLSVGWTFFFLGKKYCKCKDVEHVFIPQDIDEENAASGVFKMLTK